jgi:FkbM family methyltransferase
MLRRLMRRAGVRVPDWLCDADTAAMRRMAALVGPDDVVIDLGAHVGNATIEFALRARRVLSFEPNPAVFAELRAQTRRYGNVELANKAVSDVNGITRLWFEPAKRGRFFEGATIMEGKTNIGYGRHADVETVSIVDVVDSVGGPVAVMKIDIEGAEYRVLDALIASGRIARVAKIYVEDHCDRIPGLAEARARTLAAAAAGGWADRLDFTWP